MCNIRIIVAAHKKYQMPQDKMYLPVQVGAKDKENIGYQRDCDGENISDKNHIKDYGSEELFFILCSFFG